MNEFILRTLVGPEQAVLLVQMIQVVTASRSKDHKGGATLVCLKLLSRSTKVLVHEAGGKPRKGQKA